MTVRARMSRALAGVCLVAAIAAGPATGSAVAAVAATDCMPTWSVVLQSTPSLHGVDAVSPTDVWAVGDGAGSQATTVHFDGTDWTTVDAPVPSGAGVTNTLASVDARATTDVWAVGNAEDLTRPMIEHWDGTSWHLVASPAPHANVTYVLLTVRARAARDVWAGGYRYNSATGGARHALVEHWNGTSWRVVATAKLSAPVSEVRAFAPIAAKSVWAVGRMAGGSVTNQSLIERWNGSAWTRFTSPSEGPLSAAAAVTSSNVWAAGSLGFAHRTGSGWHGVASATTARGLAVVSAADIWSTGPHFTGGNWRTVTGQVNGGRADRYDAVTVGSPTEAWRVGFRVDTGIIEHLCAIDVGDAASTPDDAPGGLGATAIWHFDAANTARHTVSDASGLGLFDSGLRPAGGSFTWTLAWAGSFRITDTPTGNTSVIRAPLLAQPRSGGTTTPFAITWATTAPPGGDVLEVQIRRPGDADFGDWQSGSGITTDFVPDAGAGDYFFRARVANTGGTLATGWSRNVAIHVT
jgi:hypothetical protein